MRKGEIFMNTREYIRFLNVVEKLKCHTRHSWTSTGRNESVADHSWRLALMAYLAKDEYPALDIDKVIKMCLVHDLGEALTGDIPSFYKTEDDEEKEEDAIAKILAMLPTPFHEELTALFAEMDALETPEAKLFKALDNLEVLVSHNEAPISTWIPLEYTENLTYGEENAAFSPWTRALKETLKEDSLKKMATEGKK